MYFLEAFLIFCLLEGSVALSEGELRAMEYNELTVALRGRTPGLELAYNGSRRNLRDWCLEICDRMQPICEFLDADDASRKYDKARQRQIAVINEPEGLPSTKILKALSDAAQPFHHYSAALSVAHRSHFAALPPDDDLKARFERLAVESHEEQRRLESEDSISFEEFVAAYLDG